MGLKQNEARRGGGLRFFGVLGLTLLAAAAAAQDQGPGFVLQGEGGLVTAFALDPTTPSTIYAATARGLYRTTDAGTSWARTGVGLHNHSLLSVAVDPQSSSNLYAATDTGGVFRSTDSGEHWVESNAGISARYVDVIAVDPSAGGVIYAGAEGGRIFRSADGAVSWTELPSPTSRVAVTAIAIDAGRLLAGTNSEGVFWTDDGGTTWLRPVGRLSRGTVWNLTVDHGSKEIFAGTHDGFFRSSDRGANWTAANKGLRSWNVMAIATDPSSPSTLYAGTAAALYKSTDRAQTWTELKSDLYITALAIDPRAPSTLYAATHLGVLKSESAGEKWAPLRMAPKPEDPGVAQAPKRKPTRSEGGGDDSPAAKSLPLIPMKSGPVSKTPGLPALPVPPPTPHP